MMEAGGAALGLSPVRTMHEETTPHTNDELKASRYLLRSLLPIAAVLLILSTFVIGPFGFAVATVAWWLVQKRL